MQKAAVILIIPIFILTCALSALAEETNGLTVDIAVSDSGILSGLNSDVRYVSILVLPGTDNTYMIWYEDLDAVDNRLLWARLAAGTDSEGNTVFTKEAEGTIQGFANDGTFGRPSVFLTDTGFGMYLWRNNTLYYSHSTNGQTDWSTPTEVFGITNALGVVDTLLVGSDTYLYWVDSSNAIRLSINTTGGYTSFTTSQLLLDSLKFAPTGQILRHELEPDNKKFYLFYVTETEVHAGLAVSDDGINGWQIVRDADDYLLTGSDSTIKRKSLRELTVSNGGPTFNMFYTADFNETETKSNNSVGFAKGRPGTVHVRPGHPGNHAQTIQEGVDSVKDGGKVIVGQAQYAESVSVGKPVYLLAGDGSNPPILDFSAFTQGIYITADDVTITDFIIQGNNTGVPVVAEGSGKLVLNRIHFDGYGEKALIARNTKTRVNARSNIWNTLRPADVVEGDVDFGSFTYTAKPVGNTIDLGELALNFGENTANTTLITALDKNEIPTPPPGKNSTSVNWKITPETRQYDTPVTVRLAYEGAKPGAQLTLYHYGEKGVWEPLDNITVGDGYVEGTTKSFSTFSVFSNTYNSYGMNTNLLLVLAGLFTTGGFSLLYKEKKSCNE
ncbi:MAG: hypothetical protein SCM57_05820 [Bacillota bacterium]|nr:hypothetical protein [Bacillota bacterium]